MPYDAKKAALQALISYSAHKAGLPIDGEIDDSEGILASSVVGIALGDGMLREADESSYGSPAYNLRSDGEVLAHIVKTGAGWAGYSFDQFDRNTCDQPEFGFHPSWWEAEAEVLTRLELLRRVKAGRCRQVAGQR